MRGRYSAALCGRPGIFRSAERPPFSTAKKAGKCRSRGEGFRFPSPLENPLSLKPTKQRGAAAPLLDVPPGAVSRNVVRRFSVPCHWKMSRRGRHSVRLTHHVGPDALIGPILVLGPYPFYQKMPQIARHGAAAFFCQNMKVSMLFFR